MLFFRRKLPDTTYPYNISGPCPIQRDDTYEPKQMVGFCEASSTGTSTSTNNHSATTPAFRPGRYPVQGELSLPLLMSATSRLNARSSLGHRHNAQNSISTISTGQINQPRLAPHRRGLQHRKSCMS